MANVLEAMKKYKAEEAQRAEQAAYARSVPPEKPSWVHCWVPVDQDEYPAVPKSIAEGYSELLIAHYDRGGEITEEYRDLRDNLLDRCPDGRFCCMITSAEGGEGKTVTLLNLALVMTERADRRTIVVDFDLRKNGVAGLLNAAAEPGVADLLRGATTLEQCVQRTCYRNLFFVPSGGQQRPGKQGLAGSPQLEQIVAELRREYEHVIFDTPPINSSPDARELSRHTGQVLLVVRMSKTHRGSVRKAIRLLRAANVKSPGIVLTHRR